MASKSMSSEDTLNSEPMVPPDSPGSSVSTSLQVSFIPSADFDSSIKFINATFLHRKSMMNF
jgi:hypothetical protein